MRAVSALSGAALLCFGAAVAFTPGRLPPAVRAPIDGIDIGSVFETSLLAVALASLAVALVARLLTSPHPRSPVTVADNTQTERSVETIGRSFDAGIQDYDVYRQRQRLPSPRSGPGLEAMLVATLARTEGVSEAEARRLLVRGDWTADRQAALLFADEMRPTVTERLHAWLRPETVFKRRVRATVDELERRTESIGRSAPDGGARTGSGGGSR